MTKSTLLLVVISLCAGAALAQDIEEPDVPRDPHAVESASQWLQFYWRDCRARTYPAHVEGDADGVSAVVTFDRARSPRRMRASLTIELLGQTRPPPEQAAFLACVTRRFEARTYHPDPAVAGTTVAIPDPSWEHRVLESDGSLGQPAARAHVHRHLTRVRAACPATPTAPTVTVDIAPDGRATAITVTGIPAPAAACIQRRLVAARLRFPVTPAATRLTVG